MQRRHLGAGLRVHVGSLGDQMVDTAEVTWLRIRARARVRIRVRARVRVSVRVRVSD
jgi:hypothetical protein